MSDYTLSFETPGGYVGQVGVRQGERVGVWAYGSVGVPAFFVGGIGVAMDYAPSASGQCAYSGKRANLGGVASNAPPGLRDVESSCNLSGQIL